MRAEVRVTVDKDAMAFSRMRGEGGLWVVTVNAGHIVKMVKAQGPAKLQTEAAVPTKDEILGSDGVWLVYTRARFVRSAVRVPRGRTVDEMVRELASEG